MPDPVDPIAQLVAGLETRGRPPLPWIVRWSADGRDPVAAAWTRSRSPEHMYRLLEILRHPATSEVRPLLVAKVIWEHSDRERMRSDAIRRLVPVPPTLEEVLATCARALPFVARFATPAPTREMRALAAAGMITLGLAAGCGGSSSSGDAGSMSDAGDAGADAHNGSDGGVVPTDSGGRDGSSTDTGNGATDGGTTITDAGTDAGTGGCEPDGRYGTPTSTFVLPVTGDTINYSDIQSALPNVPWNTLERLYIPAGSYRSLHIGNLPTRDPAHPLVITNQGGQVFVGNNPNGNFIWSIGGGAGWVLTGRYDPVSQTGDARFPGHRCGTYANTRDTYGFVSDDGYAFQAPYLHMGIGVQDVSDIEIEYVEVRRSGFAGIRILNPWDASAPRVARNVRVHDVYVHDTGAEGFYFGWTGSPPSNSFPGLQIYNTRILRAGNEALQIQDVGDGSHVYNSVFAGAGLHWLDNGLGRYQDNNAQISTRFGAIEIDHNVFLDGAGSVLSFWSQPQDGDGARHVRFHDNVIGDTLAEGIYFGGTADAASSFEWSNNFFRGMVYGYQIITPSDANGPRNVLDYGSQIAAPITLTNNTWEGTRSLAAGIQGGSGTSGTVTLTGNTNGPVAAVEFVNAGWPADNPGHHLTAWAPNATVSGGAAVTYHAGDVVAYGDAPDFYRCTADTTAGPPPSHPEVWAPLPAPVDDVRVAPGSAYGGMGVR